MVHFPEQIPIYYFAVSSGSQNIESYISKTKRQLGESSSAKIKSKRALRWLEKATSLSQYHQLKHKRAMKNITKFQCHATGWS